MRRTISLLIRIIISAGILFFLFKQADLSKIIKIIYQVNKPILISVLLVILFNYFILFQRWKMLLAGLGLDLSCFFIFKSFCLGLFSNLFFPSTVGGDFLKSIDLSMRTQNPKRVVASVILDRISGYSGLVVVSLLALSLGHRIISEKAVFLAIGMIAAILAVILTLLFSNFLFSKLSGLLRFFGRTGEVLSSLHNEIYNFRNQKKIIIKNFIYSLFIQLSMSFSIYLTSIALGETIQPLYFFILVPLINAITALPISVSGLGLREASSMYFFTRIGMSKEAALAIALLTFSIIFILGIIGGIIYVSTFSYYKRQG